MTLISSRQASNASQRVAKDKAAVEQIFSRADVRINGNRPFDIRVFNDNFYRRILLDGSLGLGESYVDRWWDTDQVDELIRRFAVANVDKIDLKNVGLLLSVARTKVSGVGKRSKAFEVGKRHYDLGNDLFATMLDERLIYSCAYWKDANTLNEAQVNKLDLVCRKLDLKPGMRVLEIGSGWGGWAKYAAQNYGVEIVGLTVSKEQIAYARESCAGLPVEFRLQDYRNVTDAFDRIVSIGMFEHVGHSYHRTFMKVVERCLKDDGLFLLHTIVGNEPVGAAEVPWITKYIFPNGEIPSLRQIVGAAEKLFIVEAMHHFGADYEKTLAKWFDNFVANWKQIEKNYDDRFFRIWTFYLAMARGLFRARKVHVWQLVLSKATITDVLFENQLDSAKQSPFDLR